MPITIHCKIGTHSSTVLRVKGKRKLPEKGEWIYGIPIIDYENMNYPQYHWKPYIVSDFNEDDDGNRFYYLSK